MNTIHSRVFSQIYKQKLWGAHDTCKHFSGGGSIPSNATSWIHQVTQHVKQHGCVSVADVGCGDLTIAREIMQRTPGIEYVGYEVFEGLVDQHHEQHPHLDIRHVDACATPELIQPADVLLVKDVLQHWQDDQIVSFMDHVTSGGRFKHIIMQNGYHEQHVLSCEYSFDENGTPDVCGHNTSRNLNIQLRPLCQYNMHELHRDRQRQIARWSQPVS
jgi:trans-aconitate methyltransferase